MSNLPKRLRANICILLLINSSKRSVPNRAIYVCGHVNLLFFMGLRGILFVHVLASILHGRLEFYLLSINMRIGQVSQISAVERIITLER